MERGFKMNILALQVLTYILGSYMWVFAVFEFAQCLPE